MFMSKATGKYLENGKTPDEGSFNLNLVAIIITMRFISILVCDSECGLRLNLTQTIGESCRLD